jgi:hypothetical protein
MTTTKPKLKVLTTIDKNMLMTALIMERDKCQQYADMYANDPKCQSHKLYTNKTATLNEIIKSLYMANDTLSIAQ